MRQAMCTAVVAKYSGPFQISRGLLLHLSRLQKPLNWTINIMVQIEVWISTVKEKTLQRMEFKFIFINVVEKSAKWNTP